MGGALLLAWRDAGVPIAGAWAHLPEEAARAERVLGLPVAPGPELPSDLGGAAVVVLSVPDDVLDSVSGALVSRLGPDTRVLHTAGIYGREVLPTTRSCGSLHPLQTVPDSVSGAAALEGAWAAVEGDPEALEAAEDLALAAGLRPIRLPPGAKSRYHAAAVLASNDLVVLLDVAVRLLAEAGVDSDAALPMLLPLVRATLDHVEQAGTARALTGPIRRGDERTVARHVETLSGDAAAVYRTLGRAAVRLARREGLDPEAGRRLLALLAE